MYRISLQIKREKLRSAKAGDELTCAISEIMKSSEANNAKKPSPAWESKQLEFTCSQTLTLRVRKSSSTFTGDRLEVKVPKELKLELFGFRPPKI
ncbi:hypothetical protein Prudu_003552 [Prunus dulcis]|uniref:Uncharacterized protein n=1 Tax=Prunus dulcis TaxID=3755 RepID=A0A4Y1QT85_PRUDU|nr:hypothetical protein Prudu_003552 [Prunus dulcis]